LRLILGRVWERPFMRDLAQIAAVDPAIAGGQRMK
jgi:hypothetical protein